jgi:hypothetical protein
MLPIFCSHYLPSPQLLNCHREDVWYKTHVDLASFECLASIGKIIHTFWVNLKRILLSRLCNDRDPVARRHDARSEKDNAPQLKLYLISGGYKNSNSSLNVQGRQLFLPGSTGDDDVSVLIGSYSRYRNPCSRFSLNPVLKYKSSCCRI